MRIAHFIPCARGEMSDATAESMVQTALWIAANGHTRIRLHAHDPWIHMARNRALAQSIAMECDYLLMQDADVSFDECDPVLEMLLESIVAHDASAVAAGVRRRARTERVAASSTKPAQIYEAEVGTGLLLIDVNRVAAISPPWFDVELNASGTGVVADEGPLFSRKLKAAGQKVYCDFTFPTVHLERRALATVDMIRRSTLESPDWAFSKTTLTPSGNSVDGDDCHKSEVGNG